MQKHHSGSKLGNYDSAAQQVWFGSIRFGSVRLVSVWLVLVRFGLAWFGSRLHANAHSGSKLGNYGSAPQQVWFGSVWFGSVWYCLVWFGSRLHANHRAENIIEFSLNPPYSVCEQFRHGRLYIVRAHALPHLT
jgi:hypothetical protein